MPNSSEMKERNSFMLFLLIVITINLLVNLYIFSHTRVIFPSENPGWWIATVLFWLVAFGYMIGRFSERAGPMWMAEPLIKAGSWWLGAMVYLTLSFLLVDIIRGINGLFNISEVLRFSWMSGKGRTVVFVIYAFTAVLLIAGYISAKIPAVRNVPIQINKSLPGGKQKVVLVSDIHLGTMISNGKLDRMVSLVNKQNADIILLAGDIFDEDLGPVIENNMGDLLKNLKARHGVYAVLGNHEFYGGADEAQQYLKDHNITVLRDSSVTLSNNIVIVGREDLTAERGSKKRKKIDELLAGINTDNPIFMMDHQPYKLAEVANHNIDLQVSGHTHNGQMWPFNYITGAIFEISKGYGKIKDTHFYVSSGYGSWGPPIRTNSWAEIVVIEISGK